MNHLDKLISQYCPNGVQWKKLGDISVISIGEFVHKDKQNPMGKYPVYNGGVSYTGFYDQFNNTAHKIVISARGSCGFVNRVDVDYWAGNSSYSVDVSLTIANWVFVYYYLKQYQGQLMSERQQGGGVPAISKKQVEDISVPLPPLPVQQEIVRILDSMTALIANLDSEIATRQQQYAHYRDKLLTFGNNVPRKTLGEVGEITKGVGIQKSNFVANGYPCIHYGQIHTYYGLSATKTKSFIRKELYDKSKYAQTGDLIIATTSEDVEGCCKACVWLGEEAVAVSGDAHIYHHTQNPMYIAYLFQTKQFYEQKKLAATGTKVVRVSGDKILSFSFPLPPLSVQQEIVAKLDAFESLLATLRRERTLRQQQYEYYRERLLSFHNNTK